MLHIATGWKGFLVYATPASHNYSYFHNFVEDEYPLTRDALYKKLRATGTNVRCYFYPLITEFSGYQKEF